MMQGATRKSKNPWLYPAVFLLLIFLFFGWRIMKKVGAENAVVVSAEELESPVEATPLIGNYDVSFLIEEDTILMDVFEGHDIPFEEIVSLEQTESDIFRFTNIQPGKEIYFSVFEDGNDLKLKDIKYQPDDYRIVNAAQTSGGWVITEEKIIYDVQESYAVGEVESSLYLSALANNLDERIILAFADVFAWDVDFALETRTGDTYRVLFENKYRGGEFVRTGKVLAGEYVNQGVSFKAFYFQPEGEDGGYYDEDGNSVEKTFLKAPVNYRYVTSGFTTSRFHPVLGKNIPHNGVDYSAAYGTPIISVADGVVSNQGWHTAFGNNVEVRHSERYTTQYAHMSSFVKGMKVGDRVEQGQVIGYVGSTGYSTGNHLHYGVREYGSFTNPKSIDVPNGDPVKDEYKESYLELVSQRLSQLENGI